MKTLIAAIALSVAAAAPVFANDLNPSEAGKPYVLQHEAVSAMQVSGFTGVGTFKAAIGDPSEAGRPAALQNGYEGSLVQVSGFTGVSEFRAAIGDPSEAGRPAALGY